MLFTCIDIFTETEVFTTLHAASPDEVVSQDVNQAVSQDVSQNVPQVVNQNDTQAVDQNVTRNDRPLFTPSEMWDLAAHYAQRLYDTCIDQAEKALDQSDEAKAAGGRESEANDKRQECERLLLESDRYENDMNDLINLQDSET